MLCRGSTLSTTAITEWTLQSTISRQRGSWRPRGRENRHIGCPETRNCVNNGNCLFLSVGVNLPNLILCSDLVILQASMDVQYHLVPSTAARSYACRYISHGPSPAAHPTAAFPSIIGSTSSFKTLSFLLRGSGATRR